MKEREWTVDELKLMLAESERQNAKLLLEIYRIRKLTRRRSVETDNEAIADLRKYCRMQASAAMNRHKANPDQKRNLTHANKWNNYALALEAIMETPNDKEKTHE